MIDLIKYTVNLWITIVNYVSYFYHQNIIEAIFRNSFRFIFRRVSNLYGPLNFTASFFLQSYLLNNLCLYASSSVFIFEDKDRSILNYYFISKFNSSSEKIFSLCEKMPIKWKELTVASL